MTGKSGFAEARNACSGAEIQWYRTRGPTGPLLFSGLRKRNRWKRQPKSPIC